MTEDKFLERLREDAGQLRYAPTDAAMWTRLAAQVRERIHNQPSVAQMLSRWFRPITVSFAMLSLVAALGVTWVEEAHESASSAEAMASSSMEITLDGDTFNLAE